ncbi:MAG: hypothetical protein ACP5I7_06565 [Sulfolobales archaeon]|jgi:hypothetical protein
MSVSVTIKVKKEIVEIADKLVRYKIARSRSHAFNILIEKGLREVLEEIKYWDNIYKRVEELERQGVVIRHGKLNEILSEQRSG